MFSTSLLSSLSMLGYVLLGFYSKTVPTKYLLIEIHLNGDRPVVTGSKPTCLLKADSLQDMLFQNIEQLPSYSQFFEGTFFFFLHVPAVSRCFPSQPRQLRGSQLAGNTGLLDWPSSVGEAGAP